MKSLAGVLLAATLLSAGSVMVSTAYAADSSGAEAQSGIHVDIPVKLTKANVVFNMDHNADAMGDTPEGIVYMRMMATRFAKQGVKGQIVGAFHGDGGYLLLNDAAYNKFTGATTGNPYKDAIAQLQKLGVDVEECGVTMKAHHWTNKDLLPGVKVNAAAIARIVQLVQEGYVQLHY